jgi:hypothetical protein
MVRWKVAEDENMINFNVIRPHITPFAKERERERESRIILE